MQSNPEWKFGVDFRHSAEWIVWKGKEEHELPMPTIVLTGEVPKPIIPIEEPGFEGYKEIDGIGRGEVYVRLKVGTMKDEATLERIIQPLESMEFYSTSEGIQEVEREINESLRYARSKIGKKTDLEEDIRRLYEKGHPGWASMLAEHYKEFSVMAEPSPLTLYVILSVILGLILGSAFIYAYVSRVRKTVDVSKISAELNDTSGRIEDKSSLINALSTRFARSEDVEKRNAAKELIKIRASLNEISNEIRAIAGRIKGSR